MIINLSNSSSINPKIFHNVAEQLGQDRRELEEETESQASAWSCQYGEDKEFESHT